MKARTRSSLFGIVLLTLLSFLLLSPFVIRKQRASSVVTITEFSDFQCPYCRRAASVVEQIRQAYGERVRVVFKQMPLRIHKNAYRAAQASICAEEQGKFWQYHDRLFATSDLSIDALNRLAAEVGLNSGEFSQCVESQSSGAEVDRNLAEAAQLGVTGTPTFFVNGKALRGAVTFAALKREIDSATTRLNHASAAPITRIEAQLFGERVGARVRRAQGSLENGLSRTQVNPATLTNPSAIKLQLQASTVTTSAGVTLSPPSIDFGDVLIGTTSVGPSETVANSGSTSLVITDISISGRDRRDFIPTYSFILPLTVPPGASVPIPITFKPLAPWRAGTRHATLEISENKNSQYVSLTGMGGTCLGPLTASSSGCPDSDGDGLNDAWEIAGGIDLNNDGVVELSEKILTNVDRVFPDGTSNLYASADPNVKDIFVKYDWMELSDQLTNGQPTACTATPLPPCSTSPEPCSGGPENLQFVYPYHSDQCAFDQACLNGVCKGHSDEPSAAALILVIQAFARHNVRLHLVRGHALPHSNVMSFGAPVADCIAELSTQTFSGNQAVDFYALKRANFNATYNGQNFSFPQLYPLMHYAIFGHRHTCDTPADCGQAACVNPDTGRNPAFNESGLSEQPGNDIIVSQGQFRDSNRPILLVTESGTFMHELGHNLGLDHGGPMYVDGVFQENSRLNFKPNYISVMNYNHQGRGISTARANCAPDDYVCKTTPVSVRIDYSSYANNVVPNFLDENEGSEAAGLNLGCNDMGYSTTASGAARLMPGTGPVDFDGNGNTNDTWCSSGCTYLYLEMNNGEGQTPNGTPGSGDVLRPYEDWPNLIYRFQSFATFND